MSMCLHDDLDDDVDEMPTPFGGRDPLDQIEEAGLLLVATTVAVGVVLLPVFAAWQAVVSW